MFTVLSDVAIPRFIVRVLAVAKKVACLVGLCETWYTAPTVVANVLTLAFYKGYLAISPRPLIRTRTIHSFNVIPAIVDLRWAAKHASSRGFAFQITFLGSPCGQNGC